MNASRSRPLRTGRLALASIGLGCALLPIHGGNSAATGLGNPSLLATLTADQRAAVARNGFVVTAPASGASQANAVEPTATRDASGGLNLQHAVYWQFYDLYQDNYAYRLPSFITTDTLLHTFSVIYDNTLTALERSAFISKLQTLNDGLMQAATYQYGAAKDVATREAARRNLAYAAVAQRLLNPGAPIPAPVAAITAAEVRLITAHAGTARSPLFGNSVDYSLFVPRGHYAADASLSRYFQAMTWYGLQSFPVQGPSAAQATLQALLLVRAIALIPGLSGAWSAVFDPITAWVGPSDDLTVRQYEAIAQQVYGANAPVSALADATKLARFIRMAQALPGPQIRDAGGQQRGFRLFGQRFVPDASIMQSLIYPHVGVPAKPRLWPSGLDVAASLGSSRATALLTGPLGQTAYANYSAALAAQRRAFAGVSSSTWQSNLYWGWLDTLRAAWGPPAPAAPPFMKTNAYADKRLATGLGSWTELRHATLLYVKQPAGLGAGGRQSPPLAYVEPDPLIYARLLAVTTQLKATLLAKAGLLDSLPTIESLGLYDLFSTLPPGDKGYRAAFDGFAALLTLVERAAEQELLGKAVAATDMTYLYTISGYLGEIDNFFRDNGNGRVLIPFDRQVAEVADVFTEPRSRQVLEEAVGDVLPIFAVVTINGKPWLARGGVYSAYEFHQPQSDRLTDDAWRKMARRPALPSWQQSYIRG